MAFTERSAATRNAILSAARKLLVERGYEAMTIRAVASLVGVDPSMVMRYYGSKAGLFHAAVDVDLQLDKLARPPRERLGELIVRHFLSRWEGEQADDVLILLLRSASTNPTAAERMREVFATQITALVARLTGAPDAEHRAALASTQLLGLALTRYVLRFPPMADADVDTLARDIGPVVQHYLTGGAQPLTR
ncbi:TetR/AcrR family transcriptional regulator [Nonomuraea sp. PA05]|uniref:TetR/AcrR family transcriptional regulator n=1 Tax=Nonomuraea sp. PA05 TaxID=2604466 RepID=UPI0011DB19C1|nr:TetR family transcriptional regulator [Nonomuraea sp. PA05]TYB50638.1 TetR/AcrR family transcriptional regulator [Nonomuraea sp. PA05]